MKQVNFSHSGGFPLEQETLERLQAAYRSELFAALKGHFSIKTKTNYIVTPATVATKGWAIIHQLEKDPKDEQAQPKLQGILYPVTEGTNTGYLKTIRTGTNLVYGDGKSQIAYFDYEAEYISPYDFANRPSNSQNDDLLSVDYYDLSYFETIKDLETIESIIASIENNIDVIEANINTIKNNIDAVEADIISVKDSYLPLSGLKAMKGDLDLDIYKLSKLDIRESSVANVRAADFRFGSATRRGLKNPGEPLGRALVDSGDESVTNLHLNYESDWDNTYVGGKVHFNSLNTSTDNFIDAKVSGNSLLLMDDANQVLKSNNLLTSLLSRISKLEEQPATNVPIGMVAIWGKTDPIPKGWEEYLPLAGRMPVGLSTSDVEFNTINNYGGTKSTSASASVPTSGYNYSQNTSSGTSGKLIISTGQREDSENLESIAIVSSAPYMNFSFNTLNPYRVVQFIVYVGNSGDTTVPTKPILKFLNITNSTVSLEWTASNDESGVAKYIVYKNGNFLAETLSTVLHYDVNALSAGTYYEFQVIARDPAGNTATSNIVNITTTATVVLPTPKNIQANSEGQGQILVEWEPSGNSSIKYRLWRAVGGGTFRIYADNLTNTFYMDTGSPNTTYTYKVQAIDAQGNVSDFEGTASATTDPSTGGGSCFDIESLVTMASGQSKKLKNIVVGDKLQGFSFPNEIDESDGDYMLWSGKLNEAIKTEVTVVNKITNIQPNYYEIKTADATIKATELHPLLVTEDGENVQWVCIKNLVSSMLLIDKTGKTKAIESILFKEEPLEVALLDVENVDNYVISGIVAHNNKPLDPPVNP